MPIPKISAGVERAAGSVKNAVQNSEKPRKVINSYEFHLGFIPQSKPHGMHGLNTDEQIERMIDTIV